LPCIWEISPPCGGRSADRFKKAYADKNGDMSPHSDIRLIIALEPLGYLIYEIIARM
jgi:hypothetical protein